MGDDVLDLRHLYQPRGRGWCFRYRTPACLIGQTDPTTGKPFGREIRRGLKTRDLRQARLKRDVILGEIRKLEIEHENGSIKGIADAITMAKEYQEAVQSGDWGSEFALEDMARDEAERIERAKGEKEAISWFKTALGKGVPFSANLEDFLRRPEVKEKTQYEQRSYLTEFKDALGDPLVEDITVNIASNYIREVLQKKKNKDGTDKAKGATVNKKISALSSYWQFMRKRGLVETNPWHGQNVHVEKPKRRPFRWDEIKTMLESEHLTPILKEAYPFESGTTSCGDR